MYTENPSATPRSPMLQGINILDFSTVLAAPFAATLCADLGAQVTKIELPDGSDALRGLAPTTPEHALYWKVVNRNKQGITLDVRSCVTDSNRQLAEIPSVGIQPSCFEGIRDLYQGANTSISSGPNRLTSEPTVKDIVTLMLAAVG